MDKDSVVLLAYQAADKAKTALEFIDRFTTAYADEIHLESERFRTRRAAASSSDEVFSIANDMSASLSNQADVLVALGLTIKEHRNSFLGATAGALTFHQYLMRAR